MHSALIHRTVYYSLPPAKSVFVGASNSSEWLLPLVPSLQHYHKEGYFHLLENPLVSKRAAIMGMFVIRPALDNYQSPLPCNVPVEKIDSNIVDNEARLKSIYDERDWIFSVEGVEGGGLISGFNSLDAYRLALHYGISDAVIVGTRHISNDGISDDAKGKEGYLWLPETVCAWGSLQSVDGELSSKIYEQRRQYQELGLLSRRKYPAQIAFTWTAAVHEGCEVSMKIAFLSTSHSIDL